ncbi:MAG: hypothetical protein J5601_02670 [Elusimicrobiaceae bacterium]|nr:hypothetical protein [Elusimicrobiaceae bacterium]
MWNVLTHKIVLRIMLGIGFLILSPALQAFEVQVGTFFEIEKIAYKKGHLVMPVTHRKYHDVRVLDQETFLWLETCQNKEVCKQAVTLLPFALEHLRPVSTDKEMWIADVSFGEKWLVTFLIFKQGNKYLLKVPDVFKFLDIRYGQQVEEMIVQAIEDRQ